MSAALTPWFPAEVKPVHAGVYETKCHWGAGFSFWTGCQWGSQYTFKDNAAEYGRDDIGDQEKLWRGLAADPSVKP